MIYSLEIGKSLRLFKLYQLLPREQATAKNIRDLFGQDPELGRLYTGEGVDPASYFKKINRDIMDLKNVLDDIGIQPNLQRMPDWNEEIKGKTPRYWIDADLSLESPNLATLKAFFMASSYLQEILPPSDFQRLQRKLGKPSVKQNHVFRQWSAQVLIQSTGVLQQKPKVDNEIECIVYKALDQRGSLKIEYKNKDDTQSKTRLIFPVGLSVVGIRRYLVAYDAKDDEVRNFALQRIQKATIDSSPVPDWVWQYSMAELQELGKLNLTLNPKPIQLELKINAGGLSHLLESKLGNRQQVSNLKLDGNGQPWFLLKTEILDTIELRDWLIGMSQTAIVLKPKYLSEEIQQRLAKGLENYQNK